MARAPHIIPKIATTAAFAAVAQPAYAWAEFESQWNEGVTGIPRGKTTTATLLSPSAATPDSRATRLHELLHARFTPVIHKAAQKLKLDAAAIQLAEDVRLGHLGRKLGLFTENVHFSPELITHAFKNSPGLAGLVYVVFASYGQPCASINTRDVDAILSLRQRHFDPPPSWLVDAIKAGVAQIEAEFAKPLPRATKGKAKGQLDDKAISAQFVVLANIVQSVIDIARNPPKEKAPEKSSSQDSQDGDSQDNSGQDGDAQDGKPDQDSSAQDGQDRASETPEPKPDVAPTPERRISKLAPPSLSRTASEKFEKAAKKVAQQITEGLEQPQDIQIIAESDTLVSGRPMQSYEAAEAQGVNSAECGLGWGTMEIAKPDLTRNHKSRVKRLGAPSTDGVFPAHLARWYVDRAVLSRVGRRPGGTLLIDISGSMSLTQEQLEEIITSVPAINIAAYSGSYDGTGRLTILAVRGRLVAQDSNWRGHHEGLNVIDGPALAWLARQPGPRIWLCDGVVTAPSWTPSGRGHSEIQTKAAYEDALRLARVGNIRRTESYKQAIAAMLGQPSTARTSVHPQATRYGALDKALT